MPVKQLILCVITIVCAVLIYKLSRSNRMQIDFPVNEKECQRVRELVQNKRIHLTMEERSTTFESIENANFSDYVKVLLDQHKNSDKSIQDFIARIPFTEHSQFLFHG
ncbi:hypothetical protein I4U23_003699 [Adineta vaga]|nr:hypothetical protein I4U23_003699 [Adineta vaga]